MKESRFRFSHVLLFLFLLGFGCYVAYMIITSLSRTGFNWGIITLIPVIVLFVVLPIYGAVCLIRSDAENLKNGESTSLYADNDKK